MGRMPKFFEHVKTERTAAGLTMTYRIKARSWGYIRLTWAVANREYVIPWFRKPQVFFLVVRAIWRNSNRAGYAIFQDRAQDAQA